MRRTILVTGGAGFIGSHYVRYLIQYHPDVEVINADALRYSANLLNLAEVADHPRYRFVHVDLADQAAVERLFQRKIDEVIHFAAESHVDRSIEGAEVFIRSNIIGTYRLLEAVKKAGVEKMVHISTDEVYGSFPTGRANEQTPLAPSNPYSATKASSDLLCQSYVNTYRLPVVITRCTNNYGPNQHPEKLIPCLILRALENRSLPIYGDGSQERDWIHVWDHCLAIDRVRRYGDAGKVYHIGAEHTITNLDVAKRICTLLGKPHSLIQHVNDRPGHDIRYSLDTSKTREELGWRPMIPFDRGLKETVEWYSRRQDWWEAVRTKVYRRPMEGGEWQ
jgi:dTDP-glucose 4,6-dehydratase